MRPRPRAITKAAAKRPKIAPDAPTVRVERDRQGDRAEGAGEERGEVEGDEAGGADRGLEQSAEDEEGEHVEADVEQAGVEEAAGQQPVPLAVGDGVALEAEVGDHRAAGAAEPAGAGSDLGQIGGDVERDQDVGPAEPGLLEGGRAAPHLGPLVGALGQRIPTGVGVMHSGQIGRPQEEQETRVSRFGWR